MSWFKKKDTIVLNCYTYRPDLYYNYPITKSNKFFPEWFKQLDSKGSFNMETLEFTSTMKGCVGMVNTFSKGVMIPLWSDIAFLSAGKDSGLEEYKWRFADGMSEAEWHPQEQRGSYLPTSDYCHMKIVSPWAFDCEEDIEWLWQQPVWNQDNPEQAITLPGVVNYKNISDTNINLMVPRTANENFKVFTAGSPLVQIIPLTERKLEVKCHLVSKTEWQTIMLAKSPHSKFFKSQTENRKNPLRCPFHSK